MDLLAINEEFYSIQGEGLHTGVPMYFIRTQGCEVGCYFCDTKYTWRPEDQVTKEEDIVKRAYETGARWACITGGEPMEQDLKLLIETLRDHDIKSHIETSGTEYYPLSLNWICLSPKDLFSKKKTLPIYKEIANEIKCVVTKLSDVDYYLSNYHSNIDPPFILNMVDNDTKLIPKVLEKIKDTPNVRIMMQQHKVMNLR
jgi:organic radical activating enzyme